MKNFFHAALVLPLVLFAVSCSESNDDGGGDDKPVKLSPDTKQEQQVYADDKQASTPIKFTATAPWTATVSEVATKAEAGKIDWLELSAYSGKAGNVSLTMTLSPNYTGQDRKAEIRIVCGDAAVVITVEQKGTTESGEVPEDPDKPEQPDLKNRIKRIEKYWYNETGGLDPLDEYYEFEYDETDRVKTIKWFEYGDEVSDVTVEVNTTITYNASSILYESKQTEKDGTSTSTSDWTASIVLENGRAVSGEIKEFYDRNDGTTDTYLSNYTFHYDEAEQLIKAVKREPVENGPERVYEYQLTWKNGNPIQVEGFEGQTKKFIDEATYGTIENNTNIDLNWLFLLDSEGWTFGTNDITDIFSIMGYNMGKRPKNMVETVTNTSEHADLPSTYHYEFDDKGRINKITEDKSIEYRIFYAE